VLLHRVEVERRALGRADELRRRQAARAHRVVDLLDALVEHAAGEQPPLDVAAAVQPRHAHMLAGREQHRPAAAPDLERELQAGGRCADDQHPARRKIGRPAVRLRRPLRDRGGHVVREPRNDRARAGAAREHDGAAAPVAAVGVHAVAGVGGRDTQHRRLRDDRRGDARRVARDEAGDVGRAHVAVGVAAVVSMARQAAHPVRRQQAQRLPALGAPRVGDLAALDDDMVDRALRQRVAHRQPAVAAADDDDVDRKRPAGDASHDLQDVTVTSVGFAMMSNTAERFCDCATSAAICSGVASASIS
jgi:hypothetical protein